jgi:hypothetical protein
MPNGPKTHHLVPNPNGGWDVKRGGGSRASSHHDTKREGSMMSLGAKPTRLSVCPCPIVSSSMA